MSTQRERLVLELELHDNGGTAKLRRFGQESDRLGNRLRHLDRQVRETTNAKLGLFKAVRDVSVATASFIYVIPNITRLTWGWQAAILGVSAEMERAAIALSNFTPGASQIERIEGASKAVEELMIKAKNSPFEFAALQDSLVKITTVMGEETTPILDGLTEAIASFGGTDDLLKRASIAIQQMGGKGVISMEELRQQLGEAVPNAARLMARSLSMTYADFVEQVSLGRVSAAPAIKAMGEEMLFEAEGASARLMESYDGLRSQIRTQFTLLAKELGDVGYFDNVKSQFADFLAFLESDQALMMAQTLGIFLDKVAKSIGDLIKLMYEWGEVVKSVAIGFVAYKAFPVILGLFTKGIGASSAATRTLNAATSVAAFNINRLRVASSRMNTEAALEREIRRTMPLVKQASFELGHRARMTTAVTAAERAMAVQMAATNIQKRQAIAQTRALNGLLSAGRIAFGGFAGVLTGLLFASLTTYILKVLEAKKETKELFQTLANDDSTVTFSHIAKAEERLEEFTKKISELEAERDKARERREREMRRIQGMDQGSTSYDRAQGNLQLAIQRFNRLSEEISRTEEERATLLAGVTLRRAEALEYSVNTQMNRVQSIFNARVSDFRESQREAMRELEKDYESSYTMTQQQYFEGQQAIRIRSAEYMVEQYRALIEERQSLLTDADEADLATIERMKAALEEKIAELETLRGRTGPVDTDMIGTSKYLDELDRELNRTIKKVQEIKYELDFDDPFAFLVDGLPEQLRLNQDVITRLDAIKQAYEELQEQEALLEKNRGLTAMGQQVQSLGVKYERMNLRARESLANINNEFISNSNLAGFGADLERLNNQLYNMGFSTRLSADNISEGIAGIKSEAEALNLVMPELINGLEDFQAKATTADMTATAELVQTRMNQVRSQLARTNDEVRISYEGQRQAIVDTVRVIEAEAAQTGALTQEQTELIAKLRELHGMYGQLEAAQNRQTSQLDELRAAWKDHGRMFEDVAIQGMESFADSMADTLLGSSGDWERWSKDLMKHIAKVITKLMLMKNIIEPLMGAMGFGAAGGDAGAGAEAAAFAKGGVMSSMGELPLKKYAKGGVTAFPQRAYFGEGTVPEAYVPLPDGRTIPVTIANADQIGPRNKAVGSVPVQVNLYNQGGDEQEAESSSRFDGEKMIVDVVMKNLSRPTPMRDAVRNVR